MRGRSIGVAALLVVGTLLWTAFGFGLWGNRQALDTQNWVDTSGELLENEPIRTALGLYIVDKLYNSEEVQARLESVLPPRLDPLAGPAAAGLKQLAQREAPRVLGSALAVNAWKQANEVAHEQLVNLVEGKLGERLQLDLKGLFQEVAAGTGLPPDVVDRLPPEVASLQIASADELSTAREVLDLFQTLVWVLLVLSLLCFGGAIALSRDRRGAILKVGVAMMFAAVALIAARRLGGNLVVDALVQSPDSETAAHDAWQIATSLLVDAAQGSFLFGFFVVLGAWLAGPGRRASAARRFSAPAFREHFGYVRAGLGVLILLLVIWGPVPWTQNFWTIVIFTVLAFAWLEWIGRRSVAEHEPSEPVPQPTPEVSTP